MKHGGHATPKLRAKGGFATMLVLLVVVLVGGVGVGWYLSNTGVIPKFSAPATTSTTLPAGRQAPALPPVPGESTTDETASWKTYTNVKYNI